MCTTWYIWRFKRTHQVRFLDAGGEIPPEQLWNYATYVLGYRAPHDIAHKRPADYSANGTVGGPNNTLLPATPQGRPADGNMRPYRRAGARPTRRLHSPKNYPIHLAGGNCSASSTGTCTASRATRRPLANLFVSLLNAVDVPVNPSPTAPAP